MDNKGKVTVFICLIISSMLLIFTAAAGILNIYSARQKAAMCGRIALSNVRSEYNRYIFDNYHILLFDLNYQGKGEGALEESIMEELMTNLGPAFDVEEVAITGYVKPADNNCERFKEQISGYMMYAAIDEGADAILESTGGEDGTLSPELERQLEDDSHSESEDAAGDDVSIEGGLFSKTEDPRDVTANIDKFGILYFVVPEDMNVSSNKHTRVGLPSLTEGTDFGTNMTVNCKFDDYDGLKDELNSFGGWSGNVADSAVGIFYANTVFNCAAEEVKDNTAFLYEREYLICGKGSDYKNLEGVVTRISAIRLPVNYSYIMSSAEKLGKIRKVSVPIAVLTGVPEPILKHLIAGCWAYVEGLAEIRGLLSGKRLAFKKNSGNWITDLSDLGSSMYGECKEAENGLTYSDYLTILMALTGDEVLHLRMLDLIQLNAGENGESIDINNSGVELSINYRVRYGEEAMSYTMTTGY